MILKALYDYYQRKLKLGEIAPLGFEDKSIPFLIVIDSDGKLLAFEDTSSDAFKKGRIFRVPKAEKRTGPKAWMSPNLLWDHIGFVFAFPKSDSSKDVEMAQKQSKSFLERVAKLCETHPKNPEFSAVRKFLENPQRLSDVSKFAEWEKCKKIAGCNVTFRVSPSNEIVAANPDIADFLGKLADVSDESRQESICLITGKKTVPALTHTGLTIGATAGVRLVSFKDSKGYDSYNKAQGENAPVAPSAEFAYTSALSDLLRSKTNRVGIGDLQVLFWSEKKGESQIENSFGSLFGLQPKDNPNAGISAISTLYNSVFSGRRHIPGSNKFFVLGVEANKSRMIVRFFICDTELVISERIAEHFGDFEIVGNSKIDGLFSIYNIVAAIHSGTDMKNVPANTEQVLISAILSGGMYPKSLQLQCLNRIRADRVINRIRAAILKAYLNRKNRILNRNEREIKMSLDVENTDIGYLCGRLFAVLERIQETALGKINATIVDRFYGSASSTPMSVFGKLIDLSNHHLSKIDKPNSVVFFRKAIGEIMDKMPASGFPSHLSLDEQSRFAIGYYHQKQEFFKSKTENNEIENKENEND